MSATIELEAHKAELRRMNTAFKERWSGAELRNLLDAVERYEVELVARVITESIQTNTPPTSPADLLGSVRRRFAVEASMIPPEPYTPESRAQDLAESRPVIAEIRERYGFVR